MGDEHLTFSRLPHGMLELSPFDFEAHRTAAHSVIGSFPYWGLNPERTTYIKISKFKNTRLLYLWKSQALKRRYEKIITKSLNINYGIWFMLLVVLSLEIYTGVLHGIEYVENSLPTEKTFIVLCTSQEPKFSLNITRFGFNYIHAWWIF